MEQDNGRVPAAPGSQASPEAPAGLRPSGFDPSRKGILDRIERLLSSPMLSTILFAMAIGLTVDSLIAAIGFMIVFANYSTRIDALRKMLRDSDGSPKGIAQGHSS